MTRPTTEQLIARLAGDAAPVRPLPRLRSAAAALLLAYAGAAALLWVSAGGARPDVGQALADPRFATVLLGLALAGLAALAALASAVPGRDRVERAASAAALLGAALAPAGALVWAPGLAAAPVADLLGGAHCLARAAALALPPLAVAGVYLARGRAPRPLLAAGLGVAGAAALGAGAVHLVCGADGTLHVLFGHALAPLLLAALLAAPVGWLLRRRAARA